MEVTTISVTPELVAAVEKSEDLNSLVQVYISCRDGKEELKRQKAVLEAPLDDLMKTLEGRMMTMLDKTKQESARTAAGTVYKTKKTSAKVADWNILVDYIKKNDAYDLLTKAVSKDAVKARIDAKGEIVPGVDMVTFIEVGVRKS